jgi:hypothetical protein
LSVEIYFQRNFLRRYDRYDPAPAIMLLSFVILLSLSMRLPLPISMLAGLLPASSGG